MSYDTREKTPNTAHEADDPLMSEDIYGMDDAGLSTFVSLMDVFVARSLTGEGGVSPLPHDTPCTDIANMMRLHPDFEAAMYELFGK